LKTLDGSVMLLISPEPWSGHFVSKHHYAITLANKGFEVYFLNPPNDILKEILITKTDYINLWEVSAPKVVRGLRFYPKFLRVMWQKKWLARVEKSINRVFTTIWLFENSRFYDMEFAGERLKIYHQVDLNQNFHPKEASQSADISFCVSDTIQKELIKYTHDVFKIGHGVSQQSPLPLSQEQQSFFNTNRIQVAYIGNLDIPYLDDKRLVALVLAYPRLTFHFVGGYDNHGRLYQQLQGADHVVWWGRVESALIPSILARVDITLLLYQVEKYPNALTNSHKILEYFASGKVTVATYTQEYSDKQELLEMVDCTKEYREKFDEVVNHLAYHNSKQKQHQRVAFAKEHTYEKQLLKIVGYLKEYNRSF
jgi:glycosyltransferase involved in cell wall biosynthesis